MFHISSPFTVQSTILVTIAPFFFLSSSLSFRIFIQHFIPHSFSFFSLLSLFDTKANIRCIRCVCTKGEKSEVEKRQGRKAKKRKNKEWEKSEKNVREKWGIVWEKNEGKNEAKWDEEGIQLKVYDNGIWKRRKRGGIERGRNKSEKELLSEKRRNRRKNKEMERKAKLHYTFLWYTLYRDESSFLCVWMKWKEIFSLSFLWIEMEGKRVKKNWTSFHLQFLIREENGRGGRKKKKGKCLRECLMTMNVSEKRTGWKKKLEGKWFIWRIEEKNGRKGKGERKDENCKKQEMESKVRGRERNVKRKWTEKTSRMDDQLNQVKKIIKV